ncbi:hypothetical protein C5167_035965 [Papaver somniferum]|nr:hypothetical protein C5167_035965 [Papaver somniferum]
MCIRSVCCTKLLLINFRRLNNVHVYQHLVVLIIDQLADRITQRNSYDQDQTRESSAVINCVRHVRVLSCTAVI